MELPAPGAVIAGKYRLIQPLASGGMGAVWVAQHLLLEVDVAVKLINPDVAASPGGRARFEREAKAAALLKSPHVVHIQDYGVDDGAPYIVMELLQGEDLDARLRRKGRLSIEETWTLLAQAAKALRRAHEAGIIHRDLKPRNLFLARIHDDDEILKVLDFGIAKETAKILVNDSTHTGQIVGSPAYMSPEQIRGTKNIDARSDLWSLGVILFEALTGQMPFAGEVIGEIFAKIVADPIPAPTSIAPDLPPAVDAFFDRALARDRARRFSTVGEMAAAFASLMALPTPRASNPSLPVVIQPDAAIDKAQAASIGQATTMVQKVDPAADIPPEDTSRGTLSRPSVLENAHTAAPIAPAETAWKRHGSRVLVLAAVAAALLIGLRAGGLWRESTAMPSFSPAAALLGPHNRLPAAPIRAAAGLPADAPDTAPQPPQEPAPSPPGTPLLTSRAAPGQPAPGQPAPGHGAPAGVMGRKRPRPAPPKSHSDAPEAAPEDHESAPEDELDPEPRKPGSGL